MEKTGAQDCRIHLFKIFLKCVQRRIENIKMYFVLDAIRICVENIRVLLKPNFW